MIDTVEFKIHDLELHKDLVKWLNGELHQTGRTITRTDSPSELTTEQKLVHHKYLHLLETGTTVQVAHFNKLKSSHYSIAYRIDYEQGFISFNLSVPKYHFGHNLLHYNTAPGSRDFRAWDHCSIETNLKELHPRLFKFLKSFFIREFGGINIEYSFVQITRLDFCFNQVFDSKEDAFQYLHQIQKIKKKYSRDTSNRGRDYKTGLFYTTDRYSFKCYHKGSEFRKNDRKKLLELNEKEGYAFDVNYLQGFADRILRYEMTFRNGYMSYLFMSRIFRRDCPAWQYGLKLWKKSKRLRAAPTPGPQARAAGALTYWEWRQTLGRQDELHIAYVEGIINKTKQFYLSEEGFDLDYDYETDHEQLLGLAKRPQRFYAPAKLSRRLISAMSKKFLSILAEFQLELKQDVTTILHKLEDHNRKINADRAVLESTGFPKGHELYKKVGRKISAAKIQHLMLLLQDSTYEEIAASGLFSRQTWYNYRKDLEALGTTEQALSGVAIRTEMNLKSYNTEILFNSGKLGKLDF